MCTTLWSLQRSGPESAVWRTTVKTMASWGPTANVCALHPMVETAALIDLIILQPVSAAGKPTGMRDDLQ